MKNDVKKDAVKNKIAITFLIPCGRLSRKEAVKKDNGIKMPSR